MARKLSPPPDVMLDRAFVAILVLALVARVVAAVALPDQALQLPDATAFRDAAFNFLKDWQLHDPFRMPLYPMLIAITQGGAVQTAADIAIATCAVALIYLLALEVMKDRAIAILAGLAAALYPPFVFFAVVGLSETMFLTLVLAAFYGWYRGQFALAAVAAVLAILTRPILDLAAIFFVLYFSLVMHRKPLSGALRNLAMYGLIYCALMAPWWAHNYAAYGTFVQFNLAFGTVLYAGNNPMNTSGGGNIGEDYDLSAFEAIKDPITYDRALRDAAVKYIAENPVHFVKMAAVKFWRMWRLWPYHESYSNWAYLLGIVASFAPVCLFALIYLIGWGRFELLRISPLLLFIAYYTGIHMLLFGTIRFRLPFEPYLLIFAAAGFVHLLRLNKRMARLLPQAR